MRAHARAREKEREMWRARSFDSKSAKRKKEQQLDRCMDGDVCDTIK